MSYSDDHLCNNFFVDPDKVAAVRIILGLEPYGHLCDDDGEARAFDGVMSDVINAALERFVECPERVKLLFEQEKTAPKLLAAITSDLGLSWYRCGDVERTKIRDRLRALRAEWAEAEENGRPGGDDPTQLGCLLRVDYTISKRLSELENTKSRKTKR